MHTSERNERYGHGAVASAKSTEEFPAARRSSHLLQPSGGKVETVSPAPGTSRSDDGHTETRQRLHFLDNLRTFVILLVVLCHAGGVYESSGIWASFWIVDDPSVNNLSGLVNIVLDIVMMPALFFISGYLAPVSLGRKNTWAFLQSKFTRLIVPWGIAVFTLIPAYKLLFLYSRDLPQENWTTYFHWTNGIWSQNWLWFLPVLFLFNAVYLLLSRARIKVPHVSLTGAILAAFLIGFVYSLGMDLLSLRGWTKTVLLDFQNERLLIYFLAFLVGALCFRRRAFETKPESRMLYIVANSIAWIPITVYIFFLLYPWFRPGHFVVSPIVHRLILWFSFHLSLLCLLYVMIETFRRFLNQPGKFSAALNGNSYGVYIIHVIVLGGLAFVMLDMAIPSISKYVILAASTFVVSNVIVSLSRRAFIYSQTGFRGTVARHAERSEA